MQEKASVDQAETRPQFSDGFGSAAAPKRITICLRELYDPRLQPSSAPVRIRPPGPRAPTVAERAAPSPGISVDLPTTPIVRRRARSLSLTTERRKAPKSPQVRFVDSMGLELEEVRFFKAGQNPLIPPHVFSRLLMSSELAFGRSLELPLPYFKSCFPDNMAAQPGFLQRLHGQRVCLAQVLCSEVGITGTIRVLNLAFEKEITVHYSFTNWRTCTHTAASWVSGGDPGESESETDIFHFWLPVPPFILQPGAILEFAICYGVEGHTYWDNNDGKNYKLSCHSYKLIVPRECEGSMLHFT